MVQKALLRERLNCWMPLQICLVLQLISEKTKAVWIGDNKGRPKHPCTDIYVKWVETQESFRALGMDFIMTLEAMVTITYNRVLMSILKLIIQWSKRNLTVLGRVTIVKFSFYLNSRFSSYRSLIHQKHLLKS